jgi:DNA-binding winged helix-turn-helix (wHTH) protein
VPSTGEHQVLEFRLLGALEVAAGGRVAVVGSPKQRALLAMLVVHLNRVVPLDAIVEELWGERLPASASASVQSLVSRLRRSLSDLCAEVGGCLRGREPGYVLEADPAQVDANRFEELVARGPTGIPATGRKVRTPGCTFNGSPTGSSPSTASSTPRPPAAARRLGGRACGSFPPRSCRESVGLSGPLGDIGRPCGKRATPAR